MTSSSDDPRSDAAKLLVAARDLIDRLPAHDGRASIAAAYVTHAIDLLDESDRAGPDQAAPPPPEAAIG